MKPAERRAKDIVGTHDEAMASHDRREFDKYLKFLTNKVGIRLHN